MGRVRSAVLVGRDAPLRTLSAALEAARGGDGRFVHLRGDAGLGKSRLLREVVARARERGMEVLTGRAVDTASPEPYRPLAEAVVGRLRGRRPPDAPELTPFRAALARIVPGWSDPAGTGSGVFLGEGVVTLLRVLGAGRGALLALEDLHWADPETLDVVDYLVDALPGQPVCCIATSRPEPAHAATRLSGAGARGAEVVLDRLDPDAVERMARLCLGVTDLPPTAGTLLARADGVPLLVEEILGAAAESGALARGPEGWTHVPGPLVAVPTTVADVVERALAAMTAPDLEVVFAAALLGRSLEWSVLPAVVGRTDDEVLASLRAAVGARLVVVADGRFRFRHALTADAVLARLVPYERRRLAAAFLATDAGQGDPGADAEPRATWHELAGDPAAAARVLLEAGCRAAATGAAGSARAMLERARLLARGESDLHTDVDEALVDVAARAGDAERAFTLGRALLARPDGRAPSPDDPAPARAARLHLHLAGAALAAGWWPEAATQAASAASAAGRDGPTGLGTRADAVAAQVALEQGRLDEAEALAGRVVDAADAVVVPGAVCEALEVLGRLARRTDPVRAGVVFRRQLDHATHAELPGWRARALHQLGVLEQLATLREDGLVAARAAAEEAGLLARVVTIDLQLATGRAADLRGDAAVVEARRCVRLARRWNVGLVADALVVEAHAHGVGGDHEAMRARLAEVEATGPDEELRGVMTGHCLAVTALLDEDRDGARAVMAEAVRSLRRRPHSPARPWFALWPVLVAVAGGDETEVADACALVHARGSGVGVVEAGVWAATAVGCGRRGDEWGAAETYARAEELLAPYEGRLGGYHQLLRRLVGEAALADGWGTPGSWLVEASEFFRDTGHRAVEAACRALLREAQVPVPRRRHGRAEVPRELRRFRLTAREVEVLALVAAGLSNRLIGERLVISTRTVDKHLERLRAKTGAADRTALGAYAPGRQVRVPDPLGTHDAT